MKNTKTFWILGLSLLTAVILIATAIVLYIALNKDCKPTGKVRTSNDQSEREYFCKESKKTYWKLIVR